MDSEKKLEEDVAEQPSTCSESSLSTVTADTENDMVQGELSEYECQYLGFTPKSLINGGKIKQTMFINIISLHQEHTKINYKK